MPKESTISAGKLEACPGSGVRKTDRPDITSAVYHGRKVINQKSYRNKFLIINGKSNRSKSSVFIIFSTGTRQFTTSYMFMCVFCSFLN